jgi:DNA-binding protein HU-beta
MRMTKQEFVAEVARRSQLTSRDAGKAVEAFLETVTDTLKRGGEINFTGFGKFTTQERAARTGVNPRDPSQKVEIPAARVPKFSAGSALKSAVKQS